MILEGKAWKFGDDISTDLICPGRYFHLRSNLPELAKHVLEDADPEFASKVNKGDFVVGGRNFGLGSSREHAPKIIKVAGANGVIAKSFARIFYRNAINVGLPVLECDTTGIETGDEIAVDLQEGTVTNVTKGETLKFEPLPPVMIRILTDGGLVAHIAKHGDFQV
ncbi:3-isopropylmalate dehydratase small subunit [candidate division TA06 bacterium]|uniref:3-isopropylmalate dehydratase small subunit n=1 Tax=candidate division TA06 bacterium TaxID=2250710 RepID=A0A523URA6_UNCT6|nr:MAG: 3-isopropylmalate dehydratase small subunit [candidate division TA06 bacterium]